MRLKLDENIDVRLAAALAAKGHDAHNVRDELLGGAADALVLAAARAEQRVLVTLDLDFANSLLFPPRREAGIIVLRPARPTLAQVSALLAIVLGELAGRELAGKLFVASPGRLRIYPADD